MFRRLPNLWPDCLTLSFPIFSASKYVPHPPVSSFFPCCPCFLSFSFLGWNNFFKWFESSAKVKPFGFRFLFCPLLVYLLLVHTPALLHRTKYIYKNACASLVPPADMTSSCLFFPPALMFFLKMSPWSWRPFSPPPPPHPPSSSSREGFSLSSSPWLS